MERITFLHLEYTKHHFYGSCDEGTLGMNDHLLREKSSEASKYVGNQDVSPVPQTAFPAASITQHNVLATTDHSSQANLFYEIVHAAFTSEEARSAGWSIDVTNEWILISNRNALMPPQGWKLHISAGLCSAEVVLCRVIPVLQAEHICFKIASSLRQLRSINHGYAGRSQVGKFITVYPEDDTQAVRLAVALDRATQGGRGPTIPSDHPLSSHSLVFYRYGSFTGHLLYTPAGAVEFAIRTTTGELVPDIRQNVYQSFDWMSDPFIAAGVASGAEKKPPLLIHGRYLIITVLHASPRGGTFLAVDTVELRSCVLKRAEYNAYLNTYGQDARDTLRDEVAILTRLSPDPCFPTLYDLVEDDEDLYMVMEDIQGETLEKYANRIFVADRSYIEQVIAWGRELSAILGKIHAQGLIYRDLKPANVMVTSGNTLRLIDFELVLEQGSTHTSSDIGTRGYMSPQHLRGEPANVTDDIYSLGALLYGIATRTKPWEAPDPSDLMGRSPALLNPTLGADFIQVIARCLDSHAERRYPTMQAVEDALFALEENAVATPPVFGYEAQPDSQEEACLRYRKLASRLGDTLCQVAQQQAEGQGKAWLSMYQFQQGLKLRAINTGSGGTVLALAELVAELHDSTHRSVLAEGARWLMHSADTIAHPIPGLYVGEAGVGAALLRAGQVLGDESLIVAATKRSIWVSEQPYSSQDLMTGVAGRLRFHLWIWDETHDVAHLHAAIAAGNWLVSVVEDAGSGAMCWTLPEAFARKTYVGYAHGAAGIADALLDLFEVTGSEYFLAPVFGVVRLLERLASPTLDDGSGLNWPIYASKASPIDLVGAFWCHGACGIGKFLLHTGELHLLPQTSAMAVGAARMVARGTRWANPTHCHGLAGSIEFLLDMFQASGDQAYYTEARSLATLLEAFAVEHHGFLAWPSESPSCITPDYVVGYAGVLVCLLRLANPWHLPHQLSRRGFRRKPAFRTMGEQCVKDQV